MANSRLEGFDKVERHLDDLARRAEELGNTHEVALNELFPPAFMQKHTRFASLDELEQAASEQGFLLETQEDFDAIPDQEWDAFIAQHTNFANWQEMLDSGASEYAARKLGF